MTESTPIRDNVDAAEVAKFNAMAARWWDPEGDFRPLHEINPLRLDWILQGTKLAGRRVVDIGCGGGILTEAMAEAGATVTGVDMAEGPLTVARLHQLESGIAVDYRQTTAEDLAAERPGEFDVVTCLEMLEHVPEPYEVIRSCKTLVKPGGDVFFSTINRNPKSFVFAIVGAEYVLRWLPRGTHQWRKFVTPAEIEAHCRAGGLEVIGRTGVRMNPFSRQLHLTRSEAVNYMLIAARPAR